MVISQVDTQEHVLTSPQPLAEVTLLKAKLMLPPPVPFCVDKEPDKIAVSVVVRGAYKKEQKATSYKLPSNKVVSDNFWATHVFCTNTI